MSAASTVPRNAPPPVAARLSRTLPPVYLAAALRLVVPLAVLPLMAGRLGAAEFGRLGFILVWAGLLSLLVEGGFQASATRLAVAADAPRRWRLAQQVASARSVWSAAVWPLAAVAGWAAEPAEGRHALVDTVCIAALACALGWPAAWYLQATQQLGRWARVEIVVYALLVGGCAAFAGSVGGYVLWQLAASAALAAAGWRWLRRDLAAVAAARSRLWSRAELRSGLRLGWSMLPVSVAGAAYSFALPAVASGRMAATELGVYFLADRVLRAVLASADPLFTAVYPRIVAIGAAHGQRAALGHALRWALGGVVFGAMLLAAGGVAWPQVAGALGPRGVDAQQLRGVLAVLGWLLPLLIGWKFIGYWMLGSGRHDTAYRACLYAGCAVGVAGAAAWPSARTAAGLAWVAVASEIVVIVVAVAGVLLQRAGRRATAARGD